MSINRATIAGNVCRDPRVTKFENGGSVAQFSIATNKRAYKTREGKEIPERTEYHNIVVNGGLVGVVEKYVHKGDKLLVEGEIRTREYTDKNSVNRQITEIYVTSMEMLSGKHDNPGGAPAPIPDNAGFNEPAPMGSNNPDDLPF